MDVYVKKEGVCVDVEKKRIDFEKILLSFLWKHLVDCVTDSR